MKKLNEVFSEETIYVVHSDANENNILQDFDDLAAALEYAKDNIDELTYIEEVVKNSESDEIYSTEVIWSYDEDDAEEQVVCEWCGELEYESNCRRELNLGLICSQCQSALYSRGEKPVFEEAYDSDYAEGNDIFEQEFEDAPIVSKYKLDNIKEGSINEYLVENPVYYHVYEVYSGKTNKVLEKIKYTLTDAIKFAKEHLEEEPFIKDCLYEKESNKKIHDEVVWTAKDNIDDEICFYCRKNASKADLKEVGVRDEHVKLCLSCRWLLGTRRITLRDIADRLPSSRALENPDRITFQPGVYGNTYVESLKEGLNNAEREEYFQLCKEIGIISLKDLESFMNEVGLKPGCPAQDLLQALRDYRAELGPDFKIIHEEAKLSENYAVNNFNIPGFELQVTNEFEDEGVKGFNIIYSKDGVDIVEIEIWEVDAPISVIKNLYRPNLMNSMYDSFDGFAADLEYKVERYFTEQLEEGYKIDLPYKKVKEIKDELDLHGDISFDLAEPVEESDEDGWRGASEFIIIETDNGSYEGYYNWLDQDGDIIESGADEYYDNFEELLYAIDDVYVNIVDLDEYIGSQLAEELKETKNSLNESQAQEIGREYNRLSKEFGIDFNDLVYGEEGFMKTKYPEGFPDFDGDVIYSERYWNELADFAKGKGIDLTK